ncbi:hypothetical protein BJ170DRAFT_348655 [Xylariales sp. AK1849]|nr:hypothetical protein BJ170DRAFT_348655 [Xylariales sp. AK1849]
MAEEPDYAEAPPVRTAVTGRGTQLDHSYSSPPSAHNNYHNHRQSHNPSKLPAFRFADLKKESLALPSLLQSHNHGIPLSPVSPGTDQCQDQHADETQHPHTPLIGAQHNIDNSSINPVSPEQSPATVASKESSPSRSRASTFQRTITSATLPAIPKRSISLGSTARPSKVAADVKSASDSTTTTIVASRPQQRRAPATYIESSSGPRTQRIHSESEDSQSGTLVDEVTKKWAQGQREFLLPKTIQKTASDDRRGSVTRRPPVSYKPPVASTNSSGGTASIPPIRSFRSSGSRRSLVLDMNLRSPSVYDEDFSDSNHRDRTLRTLEGRRNSQEDEALRRTPPDSAIDRPDADDSGDVFLKMAREEPEMQSAVSRVVRSTHRRPLSSVIPSYQPTPPPELSRRLSEQETSRPKTFGDDLSAERLARTSTYRGHTRDKASDDMKSRGTSFRPSPLTPRSLAFQDTSSDAGSAYSRRRQSITDSSTALTSRMSSLKQSGNSAYLQGRNYNSSPLVPKPVDSQKPDLHLGDHHTESSASTAAPSTVWDELDDLKSRIHRLELTGKLPPTSGAAISRASDERPPTANTNATTMSASPKRGSGSAAPQMDAIDTIPNSHKDGQPLLQSAVNKSKPFLAADIYSALETAATDAIALSTMIGTVGQPGPISSGVSTIGGGGATVTDRQLRRKADSICRSLTELCLALSENAAQIKLQQITVSTAPAPEKEPMSSPTITKFSGVSVQRRPSAAMVERSSASAAASPRAMSRLEERRNTLLLSSALPSPSVRFSGNVPATPTEGTGRRTSLMLPRTQRAGTEDPEEQTGRKSSLLRTRRAGTEEPEDLASRQSSMLLRTRRGAVEQEDEPRFRAPSRAVTEVTAFRPGVTREYNPQVPMPSIESSSLASSALPRRRLASSTLNTRLVQPSAPTGLATRRYVERSTPDRDSNSVMDNLAEDRGQRQFSLAQSNLLSRAGSLNKRTNRDSMLTNSPTTFQTGGYR